MTETVVVITGAAPLDRRAVAAVPAGAMLIAADGGLDHALAAGLAPGGAGRRPRLGLARRAGLGDRARRGACATRRTRGRRTPSSPSPMPPRSTRHGSCCWPGRPARPSRPPRHHARRARRTGAGRDRRPRGVVGRRPAARRPRAGQGRARPRARHDVLGARDARPVPRRHGRRAPAGRSSTTTSRRSSASASATRPRPRRRLRRRSRPESSPSSSRETVT